MSSPSPDRPPAALLDLTDSVVLVTGGGGGIGAGVVAGFVAAGARVVVGYRADAEAARRLVAGLGDRVSAVACDLTADRGAADLVSGVQREHGRLDGVVNAAGIQPVRMLADMELEQWRAVIDADLTAAHMLTQAAASAMPEGGAITHVASIEANNPRPGHAHYAAAKAGLIGYVRAAAAEYGAHRVRVNAVSPGLVRRAGIEDQWPEGVAQWQAAAPLRRLGTPDDVAHACLFLTSRMAEWVTGHDLVVDGGMSVSSAW